MAPLEQAARALYAASCANDPVEPCEPDWGRGGYKTQVIYWEALARAALMAIREPSQPMMQKGDEWTNHHADCVHSIWQAMIDAALEPHG